MHQRIRSTAEITDVHGYTGTHEPIRPSTLPSIAPWRWFSIIWPLRPLPEEQLGCWIHNKKVVRSTPGQVTIKSLLDGWSTVCRDENHLHI